jgi:catechol-2,3-dioxygenase
MDRLPSPPFPAFVLTVPEIAGRHENSFRHLYPRGINGILGIRMSAWKITTSRQRGRLSPIKFEHAGLRTTRLEQMVDWYTEVLEAEVAYRNEFMAFLWYDEQNHRLVIVARPGTVERPKHADGLDHIAFAYANMAELASTYRRLKDGGIIPARATDHGSSTSFYYLDPDGNQVELKVDSFSTPEEQHAWLRSEAFMRNPFGTPLDPEVVVAPYR